MVKELAEDRVNASLKKSSVGCVLPLTNNLREWHVTDMNGYNDKARPLEADDDLPLLSIATSSCMVWDGSNVSLRLSKFRPQQGVL